jgi:type IX secretion system PorP/SprF family membrane protein
MKRAFFFIILGAIALHEAKAQQDALFSQYMFNTMLINPAYAGSRDILSVSALYRRQWVNLPGGGAPETMTFAADSPLKNEKMGVGLVLFNDKLGVVNNSGFYGNYSYRIHLSNKSTLAFGANVGGTYYSANLTNIQHSRDNTADMAFSTNVTKFLPNIGLGLYYSTDKLYIGLSSPHLINNKLNDGDNVTARQFKHYYLMAGYLIKLNNVIKLRPSALLKQVNGAPIQLDVNCNAWFYDKFSLGLTYRSGNIPMAFFEIQLLEQFRFGYAYEYQLGTLQTYNNGSHEFMLRYEFGYDKTKTITPRYF